MLSFDREDLIKMPLSERVDSRKKVPFSEWVNSTMRPSFGQIESDEVAIFLKNGFSKDAIVRKSGFVTGIIVW